MALLLPTSGEVRLEGRSLFALSRGELKAMRAHFQMIFQDPYGSLDPRQSVARIVAEPLANLAATSGAERDARVAEALAAVGLDAASARKYPHEFSGGQRQRIAIARALITRPKLVVADEPVSALDVSIQAQVLNLMSDLQRDAGVTYLLISHDLAVVGHICEEIAVMFRGRFVETGPSDALLRAPAHPYTRELVDAAPKLGQAPLARPDPPPRAEATAGCPYAARCAFAQERCVGEAPALREIEGGAAGSVPFSAGGGSLRPLAGEADHCPAAAFPRLFSGFERFQGVARRKISHRPPRASIRQLWSGPW